MSDKEHNGKITILVSSDRVTIEITDPVSSQTFVDIEMTPENFCAALGRLALVPCEMTTRGLDRVGKMMLMKEFVFELPGAQNSWQRTDNLKLAPAEAIRMCPEGWVPDNYYGAQGSFFDRDGKVYARTTIRSWVPVDESTGEPDQ